MQSTAAAVDPDYSDAAATVLVAAAAAAARATASGTRPIIDKAIQTLKSGVGEAEAERDRLLAVSGNLKSEIK